MTLAVRMGNCGLARDVTDVATDVQIVAPDEVRDFVAARGGRLYVWILVHRGVRCTLCLLETSLEHPRKGDLYFRRICAPGFDLYLEATQRIWPCRRSSPCAGGAWTPTGTAWPGSPDAVDRVGLAAEHTRTNASDARDPPSRWPDPEENRKVLELDRPDAWWFPLWPRDGRDHSRTIAPSGALLANAPQERPARERRTAVSSGGETALRRRPVANPLGRCPRPSPSGADTIAPSVAVVAETIAPVRRRRRPLSPSRARRYSGCAEPVWSSPGESRVRVRRSRRTPKGQGARVAPKLSGKRNAAGRAPG